MATQWRYRRGGEEFGPVPSGQLKALAQSRQLSPDDLVWKEGLAEWVQARRVDGLFDVSTGNAAAALSGVNLMPPERHKTDELSAASAMASPRTKSSPQNSAAPLAGDSAENVDRIDMAATSQSESTNSASAGRNSTERRRAVPQTQASGDGKAVGGRRPPTLALVLGIGAILFLGAVFTCFNLLRSPNRDEGEKRAIGGTRPQPVIQPVERPGDMQIVPQEPFLREEELRRLRDEIQTLDAQKRNLESEKAALERENLRLKDEKESIQKEINNLISLRDSLSPYPEASFVMFNPLHRSVGITEENGQYRVVAKGKTLAAQAALYIAAKHGTPRILSRPELARRIHDSVDVGEVVPISLASELKDLWKTEGSDFPGLKEEVQFVSFHDLRKDSQRIAFLRGVDAEQMRIQRLVPKAELISRAHVQPGSLRVGNGADLVDDATDLDILDYYLLCVARELVVRKTHTYGARLAVNVAVDSPHEFSDRFLRKLGADRGPADQDDLELASKYVEDEVYAKLNRLDLASVDVLEREEIETLLRELYLREILFTKLLDLFGVSRFTRDLVGVGLAVEKMTDPEKITLLGATHILNIELKAPLSGGLYHLSARLVEVETRKVLFAEEGDRQYSTPSDLYFPQSGLLATIRFHEREGRKPLFEKYRVALRGRLGGWTAEHEGLAIVEHKDDAGVLCRPLFDREVVSIPAADIREVKYLRHPSQVHLLDRPRYAVWRVAKAVLPASGILRCDNYEGDNTHAFITIGKRAGLKRDNRMRVLHRLDTRDPQVSRKRFMPASVELVVLEPGEHQSSCFVKESGLERTFLGFAENDILKTGDVAYVKSNVFPVVVVHRLPVVGTLDQETAVRLKWNNATRRLRLLRQADETTRELRRVLVDGLKTLSVPVVLGESLPSGTVSADQLAQIARGQSQPPPNVTITHKIKGQVTLLNANTYQYDLFILPWDSEEAIDHFTMTLRARP